MNSPKILCINCGKLGHQFKSCDEPIISYGIVCFNIESDLNISNKSIENYFYNKFIDIEEFNYSNLNNIKLIPHFYDKIKIVGLEIWYICVQEKIINYVWNRWR